MPNGSRLRHTISKGKKIEIEAEGLASVPGSMSLTILTDVFSLINEPGQPFGHIPSTKRI